MKLSTSAALPPTPSWEEANTAIPPTELTGASGLSGEPASFKSVGVTPALAPGTEEAKAAAIVTAGSWSSGCCQRPRNRKCTTVRDVLPSGPAALVPSAKKMGGLGAAIDVPLGHKDAAFVRSHFDAIEASVQDAPRAAEIVVAVAVTDSGRPAPRVGGLLKHEIKGEDGLR